jgi:hypothetical protein
MLALVRDSTPLLGRRAWIAVAMLSAAGLAVLAVLALGTRRSPEGTAWLNADHGVGYVGVRACGECHPAQLATYRETPHSRAYRGVAPDEPAFPGEVVHEASGLAYEMLRVGDELRVRESVTFPGGERLPLLEHPLTHVVGSGHFALTYVAAVDGFLVQSPTTWYAAGNRWGMSPGYDLPRHPGMARPVRDDCLHCHVGRVETLGAGSSRLRVHEEAIGCERCHGPGALHAERHAGGAWPVGAKDRSIVHPLDLTRRQQLDLCAQCHVDHVTVYRPGRGAADWRPSLPLSDVLVTYRRAAASRGMSVVGHMEQMERSRCFEASGTMTCLTCHDPHARPAPEERAAWYRARCLACHSVESCGEEPTHRSAMDGDSCIACHMPRGDTDIPHLAFTNHRIGTHLRAAPRPPPEGDEDMTLVPSSDVSGLSEQEAQRSLGLAYLLLAKRRPDDPDKPALTPGEMRQVRELARALLEEVRAAGSDDPEVLHGLATLERSRGLRMRLAQAVVDAGERASVDARVGALVMLALDHVDSANPASAEPYLRELTLLRRDAIDWSSLGLTAKARGDRDGARDAIGRALAIEPSHPTVQARAAEVHAWLGDAEAAALHRRIAEHLRDRQARPPR